MRAHNLQQDKHKLTRDPHTSLRLGAAAWHYFFNEISLIDSVLWEIVMGLEWEAPSGLQDPRAKGHSPVEDAETAASCGGSRAPTTRAVRAARGGQGAHTGNIADRGHERSRLTTAWRGPCRAMLLSCAGAGGTVASERAAGNERSAMDGGALALVIDRHRLQIHTACHPRAFWTLIKIKQL